jgi:hypothetical protein
VIDGELWDAFRGARLPHAEWTHVAHLRVAWMHLCRFDLDEAHVRLRAGIILLNASHGIVESPMRGYHDTITRAWLVLVRAAMRKSPRIEDSALFLAVHWVVLGKGALGRHYSRARLESTEARARFVEPDLAPLPENGRFVPASLREVC